METGRIARQTMSTYQTSDFYLSAFLKARDTGCRGWCQVYEYFFNYEYGREVDNG